MNSQERAHITILLFWWLLLAQTAHMHPVYFSSQRTTPNGIIHVLRVFCYCLFCRWINDNHYYRADNHIAKASWITCAHDNICGANQLTKKLQLLKLCALGSALHHISVPPSRNATKSYHYVNWAYTNTHTLFERYKVVELNLNQIWLPCRNVFSFTNQLVFGMLW